MQLSLPSGPLIRMTVIHMLKSPWGISWWSSGQDSALSPLIESEGRFNLWSGTKIPRPMQCSQTQVTPQF